MIQSDKANKLELLVQRIHPQGRLLRAWELKGGISAHMTALEVLLPDGQTRKMIVRQPGGTTVAQYPHAAEDEFRILQIVRSAGIAAPAPICLDSSGEIFARPTVVIEYIEGLPEFAPADVAGFVSQMAAQLARIHRVDGSHSDLAFLPRQTERLAHQFEVRPANPDASLDEERIRDTLEPVWPLPQPFEPVLLHGDFWPGNLLWRDGQLVAVIDWEDAEVGNPLADLAISRLDILWTCGIDAMHEFTRQYQAMAAVDSAELPYWDLLAALRPACRIAEWAASWPALGRKDITEETMRVGHKMFITQAFEKLSAR